MTRRLAAVGAVVAILMVAWVGWKGSPPALAHALLVRSDPPVNAQLREAPKAITMYFSEAVEQKISTARVVDGNNKRVDTGVEFDSQDNALMKVNVGPMPPGYYTVVWATLSKVDGHRISGSFPITVLNPDGSKPAGQAPTATGGTTSGGGAKPDRALTKWLLLISGSAVLGGLAFAWVSSSFSGASGEEATAAAGNRIIATAVIAILALGVFGLVELAIQADTLGGLGKVGDVFSTQWGTRWLIRNTLLVPLLLVVLVLSRARKRLWHARPLLFAAMALVLAYLVLVSSVSHSAAGAGAAWATSSDFLHLTAASLWTGLLLQLGLTLRWVNSRVARPERPVLIASVLQRFSLIAVLSVAILLFTGTLNAIFDVGSFSDLINSSYGEALLIKLIVIVPLLAAGGFNAYVYRPRILAETADERGRPDLSALGSLERSLRRTVLVEGGLVVLVLLVVGVLVQLPPTRAGIAAPKNVAGKYTATKNVPDLSVTLVVDPNEAGDNSFETYLTGAAASVQRVQLRFIDKSKRLPESDLVMDPSNPPIFYVGRGPYLSQGGDWQILVDLRRNTGSDVAVPFDVTVAGATGLDTGRGGGSWAWPRSLSVSSLALLIAATCGTLALVVASWPRPELPAGRMGVLANRVVRIHVRPSISLSIIVVLGIGLGILLGAHSHSKLSSSAAAEGNPIKSSPESIARGMQLFMANCTQCHGESGRGDGPLAASLPIKPANLYDHIPYHPDQFFYGLMTNGLSGIMPAFGSSISDDDRWNILNYLRSQFGQPPPTQ